MSKEIFINFVILIHYSKQNNSCLNFEPQYHQNLNDAIINNLAIKKFKKGYFKIITSTGNKVF